MTHSQTQGAEGAGRFTGKPQPVTILYTNYRGETAVRRILIDAIAYGNEALGLAYGWNEWHPEEQWLLSATDADKGERRTFAMAGIKAWGQAAVDAALASSTPVPAATPGVADSLRALMDAARPFYACVFNDNGDVSISTGNLTIDHWLALDRAFTAAVLASAPSSPGVPDNVRALSEAASEDWATNDATPYILGPQIDGEHDRFEVIARGPHGYAKSGDEIRKWQANRMFAVAAVNFVRTLISTHPAGQRAGQGAEPRRMAEGCCSAVSPCSHQQRDPCSLCAICQKANVLADKIAFGTPDSTRTEAAETEDFARALVKAWEVLPGGHHSTKAVEQWLCETMHPIVNRAREALAARPEAPSDAGWRDISTAEKKSRPSIIIETEVQSLSDLVTKSEFIGHWAEDLSGSEQPPFRGWFYDTGYGFAQIPGKPKRWRPLPTPPSDPAPSGQAEG